MAKKKDKKPKKREFVVLGGEDEYEENERPVNKQVLEGESITIEECKKFIADCKKGKRDDYIIIADRSWDEIEKRNKNGKLYGGQDLYKIRRWTRFPLWWACWKIRQPIVFARLPDPILKDTQGDDPIGRTACVIGERFIKSILKTFDCYSEFGSCRDDFLVTNWAWGRWFYKIDSCYEEERVRLQIIPAPMLPPELDEMGQPIPQEPQPPILLDPRTNEPVPPDANILEDEKGPYLLTGEEIIVENEEVYFQSQLYSALYIEPDIRKWSEVSRLAYEYHYSYRDFREKFGQEGLDKIVTSEVDEHRTGKPIIVYEYWDRLLKECRWFAESSDDFFQPSDIYQNTTNRNDTDDLKEVKEQTKGYDNSDLYGLSGFFPSTEPLAFNQSTKTIWPTPEFFQVQDIIDDINSIVSRLVLLTKAIRIRFLYDSSVPELSSLISEAGEASALGVPNLTAQLIQGKGTLATLVSYLPVQDMVEGVKNMYEAFAQRLDMFYQITGISDLIRGQTNPDSDKTYGERQMEGKFALNRIEPFQDRMQVWAKDNFLLGMEMGLKLFSQETVDEYITPETLDPEDKERYVAALELLKANKRRRFRVDFETDSTIAINQEWRKNEAVATANAITKMLEAISVTAQTNPQIANAELKVAKHVIGELTQGKLFIDEIIDAIEGVIEQTSQPQAPSVEQQRLDFDKELQVLKVKSEEAIEVAKMQHNERIAGLEAQIKTYQANMDFQTEQSKLTAGMIEAREFLDKEYQELAASIAKDRSELSLQQEELLVKLREVADKREIESVRTILEQRVAEHEAVLNQKQQEIDKIHMILQQNEAYMTEARLQREEHKNMGMQELQGVKEMLEIALKKKELDSIDGKKTKTKRKMSRVVRNKDGDIDTIIHEEEE